jgi:hypothetical protein
VKHTFLIKLEFNQSRKRREVRKPWNRRRKIELRDTVLD